jgi:hypothetical protein
VSRVGRRAYDRVSGLAAGSASGGLDWTGYEWEQ